jgi:hypothetical protein
MFARIGLFKGIHHTGFTPNSCKFYFTTAITNISQTPISNNYSLIKTHSTNSHSFKLQIGSFQKIYSNRFFKCFEIKKILGMCGHLYVFAIRYKTAE